MTINIVNIMLLGFTLVLNVISGYAQSGMEKELKAFTEINLSSKWKIDIKDKHVIQYTFTDSLDLCHAQDISPLKYYCLDTLTEESFYLKISFENGWTRKKIKDLESKNAEIVKIIKERIIQFGDSLEWKGMKTNKQLVESRPINSVSIVSNWSKEELVLIESIKETPFDFYKGYGVFIERNADYINPRRKQLEIENLYLQLVKAGLKSFKALTKTDVLTESKSDF